MKTAKEYYDSLTAAFKEKQKEPFNSKQEMDDAHREFMGTQLINVVKELNKECQESAGGEPEVFFGVMIKADLTWREFAKLSNPDNDSMQEVFLTNFEVTFPTIYQMFNMFKQSGKVIPVKEKGGIR